MTEIANNVVYPIPPAFNENDKLDIDQISSYLKYLRDNDTKVVMTTAGTSRFNLLTAAEILWLNSAVAKSKMTSIIGLPAMSERMLYESIEAHNNYIVSDIAAYMVLYPDRHYAAKDIIDFFHRVADFSDKPIMFHGMFMRDGKGGQWQYNKAVCEEIRKHDNIIGMKEESLDLNTAYSISTLNSDAFTVIPAGGSCKRFIYCHPAGATSFLGGIGNIWPRVEQAFLTHCSEFNYKTAWKIVNELEEPFMAAAKEIGWHKFLQGMLNKSNLLRSHNRRPFSPLTKAEEESISKTYYSMIHKIESLNNIIC